MRIPFSQLRFGNKDQQVWGIQLMRHIFRMEERSRRQYIPKGLPGIVHLFGELHGIRNIQPKRHLELLPYVVARMERFEKEEGNPFLDGKSKNISAGLDGKSGFPPVPFESGCEVGIFTGLYIISCLVTGQDKFRHKRIVLLWK